MLETVNVMARRSMPMEMIEVQRENGENLAFKG